MSLLIDSHILLWYDKQDPRLRKEIVSVLRPIGTRVVVSAATIWELSIKRSLGRLPSAGSTIEVALRNGFEVIPVTPEHAERVATLPLHHNDLFDRLLIAQALIERLTLVTHDAVIWKYDVPILRA